MVKNYDSNLKYDIIDFDLLKLNYNMSEDDMVYIGLDVSIFNISFRVYSDINYLLNDPISGDEFPMFEDTNIRLRKEFSDYENILRIKSYTIQDKLSKINERNLLCQN